MDTKSKILVWSLLAVFVLVSVWNYRTLVAKHHFVINTHIACDQSKDSCFTTACDPSSGEDCTEEVYAKLEKWADSVPLCDKFKEQCPELSCADGEAGCTVTYCSSDAVESGESCVGPDAATTTPVEDASAAAATTTADEIATTTASTTPDLTATTSPAAATAASTTANQN